MVSKDNDTNGRDSSRPIQIGFSAESREIAQGLDLNELLITRPSSTFFFRLSDSIAGELRLNANDILIVDRSESPCIGSVVIFSSDEGFVVGKYEGRFYEVFPTGRRSRKISTDREEILLWGVVIGMVRYLRGGH